MQLHYYTIVYPPVVSGRLTRYIASLVSEWRAQPSKVLAVIRTLNFVTILEAHGWARSWLWSAGVVVPVELVRNVHM